MATSTESFSGGDISDLYRDEPNALADAITANHSNVVVRMASILGFNSHYMCFRE